jgi:transposase InsO family protein
MLKVMCSVTWFVSVTRLRRLRKHGYCNRFLYRAFKWESVSMDVITQLPVTKKGYDTIAVFVDRLTKMVHFAPTYTDCSAVDVARLFNDTVFKHHGLPSEIISDRDHQFTSKFWRALTRLLGTKLKISTAFHPQTDGQTERSNRVLENYLRHYISPSQDDWDEWLPQAKFSVNNAWQESIKNTPFLLNFGQQPRTPLTQSGNREVRVPQTSNFAQTMKESLDRAKASLLAAKFRQKLFAYENRREVKLPARQKVLLSTINFKLAHPGMRKLLPKWVGPFEVTERIGKVAYKLDLPPNLKMHNVFHVQLFKKYRDNGKVQPPPPPIEIDDSLEYEVERVLGHRKVKRGKGTRKEFLVKWLGYKHEHNTWEPEKHLTHCEDLLADYWTNVATSPQGVREKQAESRNKRKAAELERNRSVEQNASEPAGQRRVPSRR